MRFMRPIPAFTVFLLACAFVLRIDVPARAEDAGSNVQALDDRALVAFYERLLHTVSNQPAGNQDIDKARAAAIRIEVLRRGQKKWDALANSAAGHDGYEDLSDEQLIFLNAGMPERPGELSEGARGIYNQVGRAIIRRGGLLRTGFLQNYEFSDVQGLDDADLLGILRDVPTLQHYEALVSNYDRVIAEMARRGGQPFEVALGDELSRVEGNIRDGKGFPRATLGVLTALRRLQRKPDPVTVTVKTGNMISSEFGAMPVVSALLTNVDNDKKAITFMDGGNSRSGRSARWLIRVTGSDGKLVPVQEWPVDMGGMFTYSDLAFEQQTQAVLPLAEYVDELRPGDYKLQVFYHDSIAIADEPDAQGLTVVHSEPVKLHVEPLRIKVSEAERARLIRLVGSLGGNPRTKVIEGGYGKWAEKAVTAESPEGQLLNAGTTAIPFLLRVLFDGGSAPTTRAQALAILFSLTGRNDPREERGVLGPSLTVRLARHPDGSPGGATMELWTSEEDGKLDVERQNKFAVRWTVWRDSILLVDGIP